MQIIGVCELPVTDDCVIWIGRMSNAESAQETTSQQSVEASNHSNMQVADKDLKESANLTYKWPDSETAV